MVNESILSLFPPRSDGRRSYSSNSYNPPPPLFNRDDWSSVKREQGSNLISFIQFVEMFFSLDWSDEIWKCWTQISLQDHWIILIYFAPSGSYHQSFLRIHRNGNKFKQGTIVSLFKFVHSDTPIKVWNIVYYTYTPIVSSPNCKCTTLLVSFISSLHL